MRNVGEVCSAFSSPLRVGRQGGIEMAWLVWEACRTQQRTLDTSKPTPAPPPPLVAGSSSSRRSLASLALREPKCPLVALFFCVRFISSSMSMIFFSVLRQCAPYPVTRQHAAVHFPREKHEPRHRSAEWAHTESTSAPASGPLSKHVRHVPIDASALPWWLNRRNPAFDRIARCGAHVGAYESLRGK